MKSERKCSWPERIRIGSILGIILFVIFLSFNSPSFIVLGQTAGFTDLATALVHSVVQASKPCIDLYAPLGDQIASRQEVEAFLNQTESFLKTTPSGTQPDKNPPNQTEDNFIDSSNHRCNVLGHETLAGLGSYQEGNLFPIVQLFGNR